MPVALSPHWSNNGKIACIELICIACRTEIWIYDDNRQQQQQEEEHRQQLIWQGGGGDVKANGKYCAQNELQNAIENTVE